MPSSDSAVTACSTKSIMCSSMMLAGASDRVARVDGAVRLDLEDELVVVGALTDTRVLHHVRAARDRARTASRR